MKKLIGLLVLVLQMCVAVAQNAPVAANDTFTVLANQTATLPVTANDFTLMAIRSLPVFSPDQATVWPLLWV
jgi:hypothetical protein